MTMMGTLACLLWERFSKTISKILNIIEKALGTLLQKEVTKNHTLTTFHIYLLLHKSSQNSQIFNDNFKKS